MKSAPSKPLNKEPVRAPEPDFPQIELNLPKRPLRERLGTKNDFSNNKRAINTVNLYQANKLSKNNSLDHSNDNYSKRYITHDGVNLQNSGLLIFLFLSIILGYRVKYISTNLRSKILLSIIEKRCQ